MHETAKPDFNQLLDSGRFDPNCAESSWTLPASWYFDPQIFQLECEKIFDRSWHYLCHVTEVTSTPRKDRINGRYITLSRNQHGMISAFDNSANHSISVEALAGFVFVNLDPTAQTLATLTGNFVKDIYQCCPQIDQLVPTRRIERNIKANWKTLVDNNHECYHCALNHKSLMKLVDYENQADWRDDGITFTHTVKRKQMDNPAYHLNPDEIKQDSLFGYIWPNLIPLWFPGSPGAVLFQIIPTGPESSVVRHDFYFLSNRLSQQEQAFVDYIDQILVPEDLGLCETVQRGLHSQGYRQGKLIVEREKPEYSEHHVHFFQQMVYRALTE